MAHKPTNPPTIIDLKTTFLRTQILTLSTPLRPSSDFTTSNTTADVPLREKAIDDALYKLNAQLRRHNKLSYGPQATRHVGEQIDKLYWNNGERGVVAVGGVGGEWRERAGDLRDEEIIAQIPEQWESVRAPEAAEKFGELAGRLKELDAKRRVAREKVEGYRKMRGLLKPFGEEGGLQENLVTRNGEVERELERMRMLMLRVERGVEGLGGEHMDVDVDVNWEEERRKKVDALLKGGA